ncbi:MAG: hypothetical protein N2C14_28210, partial [Planctomycetales bacterium]
MRMIVRALVVLLSCATAVPALVAAEEDAVFPGLERFQKTLPRDAGGFVGFSTSAAEKAARELRDDVAAFSDLSQLKSPGEMLRRVERMAEVKTLTDQLLSDVLDLRWKLAALPPGENRNQALRHYLLLANLLADFSGRVNWMFSQSVEQAAIAFAPQPAQREQLIDLLREQRSAIGSGVMSLALLDPPQDSPNKAQPASAAVKVKLLQLAVESASEQSLPVIAEFVLFENSRPALKILAAQAMKRLGMPQEVRPGEKTPRDEIPFVTAASVHEVLTKLDVSGLSAEWKKLHAEVADWCASRKEKGLSEDSYRFGP